MAIIIAEIGQNHQGNMPLATMLIKLAKENGADLAKFQLYNTDALYKKGTDLYHQAEEAELSFEHAMMLFDYGNEIGIEVFFSVFDVERVRWCEEIGVKRYKVACCSNDDKALLGVVWATQKPTFISLQYPKRSVILEPMEVHYLMCIPKYPAEVKDYLIYNNLAYRCLYEGLSDHTIGLDAAKIALARGAQIIEKHFCINHQIGVDALWSMTPEELKELRRWEQVCKEVL